jgi:Transposase domain (DUF772)
VDIRQILRSVAESTPDRTLSMQARRRYEVITAMPTPDHSTIADFRRRHETEIGELFDEVLGL